MQLLQLLQIIPTISVGAIQGEMNVYKNSNEGSLVEKYVCLLVKIIVAIYV